VADGDLVRPIKWESIGTGGSEDDLVPTEVNLDEDYLGCRGLYIQPPSPDPSDKTVPIGRDASGNLTFEDPNNPGGYTLTELAAGAGGFTPEQHKIIRQLIHFVDDGPAEGFASGAYREITNPGPNPTEFIWWESSSKLKKIVSLGLIWSANLVTTEVWKIYDTDGSTVLAELSDAIVYSGVFETSRTRTITVYP
jgi:hypothetical protein